MKDNRRRFSSTHDGEILQALRRAVIRNAWVNEELREIEKRKVLSRDRRDNVRSQTAPLSSDLTSPERNRSVKSD